MFTTVLFDLDGTLLDTLQDLANAGNHTLAALGFPPHPTARYRRLVGGGVMQLIARMLPPAQRSKATIAQAAAIFNPYYAAHLQQNCAPYPGIPALLAQLKEAGILLGVLSNKGDEYVQPLVRRYFPGVFAMVLGLRAGFAPKPDAASVQYMMRELGADKTTTLYCGDSDVDIYTAHNAGLAACGVLWGFRTRKELAAAGADYLVPHAAALAQLILA